MKFSIITVCKNSEKTIENTILSVLRQSYTDYEYIIIDGASTDKTLDIIENYGNKISKIISEPDNGLYDAMNKGIQNSCGEYLFFLNSDDRFFDKNVLLNVFNKAKNNRKELLYGDQAFLNSKTNSISIRKHNKFNRIYLMKNTPCQPATFYKREVFERYGYFDTNFKIVSDHEWFLRAFLSYKITAFYLSVPVTVFNSGGLSTSITGKEKLNSEREKMFKMYFSGHERKKLEFFGKYFRCITTLPVIKHIFNPFFKIEL